MIHAKNARNKSATNARSFLIDFIDTTILGQMTESNTDNVVKIDLSDEKSRDVMRIKIHHPSVFREVLSEYTAQGWRVEEKMLPSENDEKLRIRTLILSVGSENQTSSVTSEPTRATRRIPSGISMSKSTIAPTVKDQSK